MDPAVPRSPVPASFRSSWEPGRPSGAHQLRLVVHADASNVDQNEIREAWKARKVTCPKHLPALIPPARQSHQHPQATSRTPNTHCARSTPSAHPFQRPQISAPLSDTLCPTLPGPHSSCVYSLKLIPPARTIYGSASFASYAKFCAVWSPRGPGLRLQMLQCSCAGRLRGRPGTCMSMGAHVGRIFLYFFDGNMLYGGRGGQGRKKCCVRSVCAPGFRSEHATVQS